MRRRPKPLRFSLIEEASPTGCGGVDAKLFAEIVMAKHHPILNLFSSLVMEAPLSSG